MGPSLIFLCLLIAGGVFGDEVKSVSVMEGHSVTLHTDVIKQKGDLIVWSYGPENTFVARINGKAGSTMFSDDERFIDRLKLNDQTGDLIINETTTHHSGLYGLKIIKNRKVSYKRFNVAVHSDVKHVSIREGHSVILYTHVLKQGRDLIEWHHGPENTLVATIDVEANSIMLSEDEMFIGRLKLDDQTGALMIHDTTTHHSGLHTLKISNNQSHFYKRFNVNVHSQKMETAGVYDDY